MLDLDQLVRDALGPGVSVRARVVGANNICSFCNDAEATDVRGWMEWVKAQTGASSFVLESMISNGEATLIWEGGV